MTRSAREAIASAINSCLERELDCTFSERDAADILAKLAEDGWKIAPVEPTQRMQRLGAAKMWDINKQNGRTIGYDQAAEIYRAMLAAFDGDEARRELLGPIKSTGSITSQGFDDPAIDGDGK